MAIKALYSKYVKPTLCGALTNKQWIPLSTYRKSKDSKSIPDYLVSRKGACIFTPNNEERKETGTYFTPDPVVQYLVQSTIPMILTPELSSEEIASKRIIDP
ncbi:MAG: hypothetical protein NTX25_24230, partial [Proteobacteria bacterium]|nr:hypothetical protein [Pseudomonadota bacterium]